MFFDVLRQLAALLFLILSFVSIVISQQIVKTDTLQLTARHQFSRDIYRELIEINTTDSVGDTTKAAGWELYGNLLTAFKVDSSEVRSGIAFAVEGKIVMFQAVIKNKSAKE